ncbi:hypothetical protein DLJ53_32590 [Acuticoccus sediminis]|uniref:HTH araC/xylS-type domain-containing protein n=1 Tax=Acuticoccus sediminis TaxID=2184697 RepID=A0A8B2ND49_9HYPH|nr:hypothetical protein DLJ53_32590 [Acuticoccus sediminis]
MGWLAAAGHEFHHRRSGPITSGYSRLCLEDALIHSTALALLNQAASGAPELYAEAAAAFLAAHLVACDGGGSGVVTPLAARRMEQVIDYMRTHIGEAVRLADLASVAGVSLFYFSRAFKAATGTPPVAYLTSMRMRLAQELLTGSELSISQIASRCGYLSTSSFSSAVQKRFGASPLALRGRSRRQ